MRSLAVLNIRKRNERGLQVSSGLPTLEQTPNMEEWELGVARRPPQSLAVRIPIGIHGIESCAPVSLRFCQGWSGAKRR